jgi:hypothetical protein
MRPQDYALPEGYSVELLEESRFGEEDAIAFWLAEGILAEDEARRRAAEILYVGVHREAGLVGISTAYPEVLDRLRLPMWNQRGYVAPAHRQSNLGMFFAIWGIARLRELYETGRDTRAAGVVQVLQNEGLMRYFRKGWEPPTDMVFIGETTSGHHVRIHPFPGAEVPLPPGHAAAPGYG